MSKIKELSLEITNQIAAGEVVERPASVVKELMENAIDAKSKRIVVKIEEAGLKEIEVIDDGEGMDREDAVKALDRYATSKIDSGTDLFRIRTLGFRGEALPSIASISHVLIVTSNGEEGTEVKAEFGQVISKREIVKAKGTTIKVSKLFNNTPARLRFMKSLNTEFSKIVDVLNRLALSHPTIQFELWHNGKLMQKTPGNGELIQAIAGIYHSKTARTMRHISGQNSDFKIDGYISEPLESRSNRHYISCFINGRYIRHYPISQAIIKGYGSTLMINRYPIAILSIEADPLLVDVNVHPSKLDVRLSKADKLEQLIIETVAKEIGNQIRIPDTSDWTPLSQRQAKESNDYVPKGRQLDDFWDKKAQENNSYLHEIEGSSHREESPIGKDSFQVNDALDSSFSSDDQSTDYVKKKIDQVDESFLPHGLAGVSQEVTSHSIHMRDIGGKEAIPLGKNELSEHVLSHEGTEKNQEEADLGDLLNEVEYVGQIHGTYLILQAVDGFYLMDQHAAQERIRYEKILASLSHPSFEQQYLLIPITLNFSADQILSLGHFQKIFNEFGLKYELFGDRTIIFRTYPTWMGKVEIEDELTIIVDQILSGQLTSLEDYRKDTAAMKSCKGAIKANQFLSHKEVADLLKQLAECQNPYNCPHGRPVMVFFSNYDIERLFKRIQDH
ncbi:DNA mismatch repair endonuclease MutL [Atopobacter sp. AH10]|uniref:DNA mismatch repair endonuclease MutL n=1 Tax=Atopobacter sp. AH10 TaxID=2315861 RepID=UPI000EF19A8F|nr:DNA mismatch repair endonuclease MutL [Atopobacter sp. AH10]RLK63231.1 DNA mismatch repair endonuclease MutL [Atopobacter sp. AH10]